MARSGARTQEGYENHMISLAMQLAEKQLAQGTASSQVITHYLKLGTERDKLEREKLRRETELISAKKESLDTSKRLETLYSEAITAFRSYSGGQGDYEID